MRALWLVLATLVAGALSDDGPATPPVCTNGGVLPVGGKECDCPSYWSGVDCGTIVCVNGGYVDGKACHCPKGYYGIHCDAVKQSRPVEGAFKAEKRSFNLYIHNELTDWYGFAALTRIQAKIPEVLAEFDTLFNEYNLLTSVRNTTDTSDTELFTITPKPTLDDFKPLVKGLVGKRTRTYTCKPTDISYSTILKEFQEKKIEDSVVLMYTQYPPISDPEALEQLKKYLRAFRIKLNVLIGADEILLDCNNKKNTQLGVFDELTDLVYSSDGEIATYQIEDEDTLDELLPAFIRASALPQSHSRAASDIKCDDLKLAFKTDPYPNTYYVAVRSAQGFPVAIEGTCSSGGELSNGTFSYYGEFALFSILSGAQQDCTLSINVDAGCLATVYSVGGAKGVDAFSLFHSFSSSQDMDSDSIYAYDEEKFYLTMHIDVPEGAIYPIVEFQGTVGLINEVEQEPFLMNLTNRGSTFEYQSIQPFICPSMGRSWIQLNLEGFNLKGQKVVDLDRFVPLICQQRKPAISSSRMLLRSEAEARMNKPAFAVLYSNSMPTPQYSKFILASVDASMQDRFSQFGYLRFDSKIIMDFELVPADEFAAFKRNIYDDAPDASKEFLNSLKESIEELTSGESNMLTSDSLISIAIQHSLTNPEINTRQYADNLAQLANLGARFLFWGDVNTVTVDDGDAESIEVYTRMAAVSAGHVVLIDMAELNDDDDNPKEFVNFALQDLYASGPSQRLLAFANLQWPVAPSTTQSRSFGSIQIPTGVNYTFVSITLNVEDPLDVATPFILSLSLDKPGTHIGLVLNDLTQYGTKSNLFTTTIEVEGGETYEGSITLVATSKFTGAHIRFWTERREEDILPDLVYKDFAEKTIQPNDYVGAALRVPAADDEEVNLRFIDASGQEAIRLLHNQTVTAIDGVAHFIPYFCNSNQFSPDPSTEISFTDLSTDMYTVQITFASGFSYFRPMLCSTSSATPVCTIEDDEGNVFCKESNPPFHRGPSQELIDCSTGTIEYASGGYKCNCNGTGFTGVSCQSSSCDAQTPVHLAGDRDAHYRTLSFVFLSPSGDAACSDIFSNYADNAKKLFVQQNRKVAYDNIWQFTFTMYFSDGTVRNLYRGPSQDDFLKVFDDLKNPDTMDPETYCGEEKDQKPVVIDDVFKSAVESVGRISRGLVIIFATESFGDVDAEANKLSRLVVGESFYQTLQAYQQQIIMVSAELTDDIISLTTASGGFALQMSYDFVENFEKNVAMGVLDQIIKGEIGWVGVSIDLQEKKWSFNQAVHLFISSNIPLPEITDCVPGTDLIDNFDFFPKDEDDPDEIYTALLSLTTPGKLCLKYTDENPQALLQVTLLTTESPVAFALLGQGQSYVDTHSAGATTNSSRAIHISFDRQEKEYSIKPKDLNWREAARSGCVFGQEFIPFEKPFHTSGPFVVDFTIEEISEDHPASPPETEGLPSLAIPLVVTNRIQCVNEGVFNHAGSYCECPSAWSGPTCSQPICGAGGILNAHGDHCDCTEAVAGGLFCTG